MFCSSFYEIRPFSDFRHTFYLSIRFVVIFIRRFIIGIIISKKKKIVKLQRERASFGREGR